MLTIDEKIERFFKNLSNEEKIIIVEKAIENEEEEKNRYGKLGIGYIYNISTEYICYNEKCEVEANDEDLYFERDEKCICGEIPRTQFNIINKKDIDYTLQQIVDESEWDNILDLIKEVKDELSDSSYTRLYEIENEEGE